MATLLRGQRERPLNIEVGEELAAQLPDDFLVVANASLNSRHPQVEFDLVVIKPSAVFVTDMAEGRPPQRPNHSMRYSGPISRVRQKAMTFSRRLRSTEIASQIFGDPRVASSIWVLPILLVSREVDETPRSSAAGYRPAILSRHQAVQYIENPNVKGYHCKLYPHEIEQFGRLLAGIDERSFQVQEAIRAANLLMRAGDHESALERLTEVQAIAPLDMQDQVTGLFEAARRIQDMTAEADHMVQIGEFERAIAIYEQVLEMYPTSTRHKETLQSAHKIARTSEVWNNIISSVAALAEGNVDRAMSYLAYALQIQPERHELILELQRHYSIHKRAMRSLDRGLDSLQSDDYFSAFSSIREARNMESHLLEAVPKAVEAYYNRSPTKSIRGASEGLGVLRFLEDRIRGQLNYTDGLLEKALTGAVATFEKLSLEAVEGEALIYLQDHDLDVPLRLHKPYDLVVDVRRADQLNGALTEFASAIHLPSVDTKVELDVTVYAEFVRVEPAWKRQLVLSSEDHHAAIEFRLTPEKSGETQLRVEFFHSNRWLQTFRKDLEIQP